MNQLERSCSDSNLFPQNIIIPNTYDHCLGEYFTRLNDNEDKLFCKEVDAVIDFWQFNDRSRFEHNAAHDAGEMKVQLRIINSQDLKDPMCRFIFVCAPHSRAPLNTTRKMLMDAFTYHQVMPEFLDFVFPFGQQEYPQGFHFGGFRHEDRLSEMDRALAIPELGRSGRNLQLCFSLKSVEPYKYQSKWPWSIRQTAIYHSFDIENGRTVWIIIKGNRLIKKRVVQATDAASRPYLSHFDSASEAFSAALATHLIQCDFSGENWRWYISFLEQEFQDATRHTLRATVDRSPSPVLQEPKRSETTPLPARRQWSMPATGKLKVNKILRAVSFGVDEESRATPAKSETVEMAVNKQAKRVEQDGFSFSDLQRTQRIEEKVNETLLVVKMNAKILAELRQYYRSVVSSEDCPNHLKVGCKEVVSRFERRVTGVIEDLHMQQSRLETLLQLVGDRKTLLYGILEYKNIQANKHLSQKAQLSADEMEKMTYQMHKIAIKTEHETVSMRIITLAALFFLPGTFISSLMSTDIIKFPSDERNFSLAALQTYLAITIPFMFITFFASWIYYRHVRQRDQNFDPESGHQPPFGASRTNSN